MPPPPVLGSVATLAALWWLLSGGDLGSWTIGAPAVAAASWTAHRLRPGSRASLSVTGAVRFVPIFLWQSLRGGVDVAARALAPKMRIRPGFVRYRTSLRHPSAREFFAGCVSLLPGTLTADLEGDRLQVHLLNEGADATSDLRRFERAVGHLFGDDPAQTRGAREDRERP